MKDASRTGSRGSHRSHTVNARASASDRMDGEGGGHKNRDTTAPGTGAHRFLLAHADPVFSADIRAILLGEEPGPAPADEPVGTEGSTIQIAATNRDAAAAVGRGVDRGQPIGVLFLDGSRTSSWDGVDLLWRIWRIDPRVEVALCVPEHASGEAVADLLEEIGESDQLVLVDPPYHPAKIRQFANVLSQKWRLAHARSKRPSAEDRRPADTPRKLEPTSVHFDRAVVERTRVESDLRKAQRLEALGRLAAGLGQEINNPLSFMISGAEGAIEELLTAEARHPEYAFHGLRELLDTIVIGAERIRKIVKNIKLLAHQAENTAESVTVSAAIEVALDMVTNNRTSDIAVAAEIDEVAPVWCKRIELEQVFINLLENSVYALSNAQPETPQIRVICRPDGNEAALVQVRDNGVGIPEDALDKVFDPFFTTKPAGVGTGLGLSICHGIVTAMGGRIDIDSTLGVGTQVSVRIPCLILQTDEHTGELTAEHTDEHTREATALPAASHTAVSHPAIKIPAKSSKGRVLVVDDEPLIRRVVKHALHAHEVVTATNGREALEHCREQIFDVILCDIMMPELNGVEFYGKLSEICPGAEDDIIFFSGGTQIEEIHAFLDRVPNECLEKPVQRRRLQQRVNQYVRQRRAKRLR